MRTSRLRFAATLGVLMASSCGPFGSLLDACTGVTGDPPLDDLCAPRADVDVCESRRQCPNAGQCVKADPGNDACGVCVPDVCSVDEDCLDNEACDVVRARCEPRETCAIFGIADACPSGSACDSIDDTTQCRELVAARCEIVPALLMAGDDVHVLALDAVALPLPLFATPERPASLDDCAGPAPCRDVVTATVGDVSCSAPTLALPPLEEGVARLVVRDADTGVALAGAAVRVGRAEAVEEIVADDDGVVVLGARAALSFVAAAAEGYESVGLVVTDALPADLELLLPRQPASGTVAGVAVQAPGLNRVLDVGIALATLSMPDLVDALDGTTLAGPLVQARYELEGITEPGGDAVTKPSGTLLVLGRRPIFSGLAVGRPGARLLSFVATELQLEELIVGNGEREPPARPYDLLLDAWEVGERRTSSQLVGAPVMVEAPEPLTDVDFAAFGGDDVPIVSSSRDATDQVDVVVPALLAGDDAAFVALFAQVPGRGHVLAALRFVTDDDGDGHVDDPLTAASTTPPAAGTIRLFVAPSIALTGRPLVAVAGSQAHEEQRNGVLASDRVTAVLPSSTVALPPFALGADDGEGTEAAVTGAVATLLPSADVRVVHGDGWRIYVPGSVPSSVDETVVDAAALGLPGDVQRVWAIAATPSSFASGTRDVAVALAAPPTARALFVRAPSLLP